MFRRKAKNVNDIVLEILRSQGLETPLMQRRLIEAWDNVVGQTIAQYTREKYIKNQTLFVKIDNPALRADLNMIRTELKNKLNSSINAQVIADVRII